MDNIGWLSVVDGASLVLALAGHALADRFQGFLSQAKRRRGPGGEKCLTDWLPWLALHGAFHGVACAVALWSWKAALVEAAAHAAIDFGKCEKAYGSAVDQCLHVACKCLWLAWFGSAPWLAASFGS